MKYDFFLNWDFTSLLQSSCCKKRQKKSQPGNWFGKLGTSEGSEWYQCNVRHYNPRLVYFLNHFWSPFLCFQGGFFRKFCPYVWSLVSIQERVMLARVRYTKRFKQEQYILEVEVETKTLPRFSSWKLFILMWMQAKIRKKHLFFPGLPCP